MIKEKQISEIMKIYFLRNMSKISNLKIIVILEENSDNTAIQF